VVQLGLCLSLVEYHPNKFALRQPFVRHSRLSVKIQRDATVRMTCYCRGKAVAVNSRDSEGDRTLAGFMAGKSIVGTPAPCL
jgi:hypothetical protein